MTSTGDGGGPRPIDPDFAGLFRPEEESSAPVSPPEPPDLAAPEAPVAPSPEDPARPAEPVADTGRLFRSQGVADHPEAVLALASDHFGRLRTLERHQDSDRLVPDAVVPVDPGPQALEVDHVPLDHGQPVPAPTTVAPAVASEDGAVNGRRRRGSRRGRTIVAGAVYLIVIGVTVLVGFANALLANGEIGWPTGLALVVSSVYAALTVRREDDVVAIIIPPVAFLIAALTAGQLFVDSLEGSLTNRAVTAFFTLADNWIWIIGATLASLVIVLVRRRRS